MNDEGLQLGRAVSEELKNKFPDINYYETPLGFVEGVNACKLEDEIVVLFSGEEYDQWYSRFFLGEKTGKELIVEDYENRAILGNELYQDLQAEIVQMFRSGIDVNTIVIMESKYKPMVDGLKTGDFVTCMVLLSSAVPNNPSETTFQAYALSEVNRIIIENEWL